MIEFLNTLAYTFELFNNFDESYEYIGNGLILIDGSLDLGLVNPLNLNLEILSISELNSICREFVRFSYFSWVHVDNLDLTGLADLNIPKTSFIQGLLDYCVYIKVNSLDGYHISYPDFIDSLLGTLEINNENFNSIINHSEFSRYLVSLLQKLEILNDLVAGGVEAIPNSPKKLGVNFLIPNELKFADLVLNNLQKLNPTLTNTEIETILNNSISKLNTISNKEIILNDIIDARSNTGLYLSLTVLAIAILYQISSLILM
jgi:hypothetical protein